MKRVQRKRYSPWKINIRHDISTLVLFSPSTPTNFSRYIDCTLHMHVRMPCRYKELRFIHGLFLAHMIEFYPKRWLNVIDMELPMNRMYSDIQYWPFIHSTIPNNGNNLDIIQAFDRWALSNFERAWNLYNVLFKYLSNVCFVMVLSNMKCFIILNSIAFVPNISLGFEMNVLFVRFI